jgi:hypothetical protein
MQAVIGETVKPEEFRVDQIRDISAGILSWGNGAADVDSMVVSKTGVFGAVPRRRCGFR